MALEVGDIQRRHAPNGIETPDEPALDAARHGKYRAAREQANAALVERKEIPEHEIAAWPESSDAPDELGRHHRGRRKRDQQVEACVAETPADLAHGGE